MTAGYEDAPGTKLLAVSCAVCAHPLLDAVSVEAGIGPDCRAKYGYAEAQGDPDFEALAVLCAQGELVEFAEEFRERARAERERPTWQSRPPVPRRFANVLVHRIAAAQTGPNVGAYVTALAAFGFTKLARRIAERLGAVEVTREGEDLLVRTTRRLDDEDFDAFAKATRAVGRWDRERKVRVVPVSAKRALWDALRKGLRPGTLVLGERITAV